MQNNNISMRLRGRQIAQEPPLKITAAEIPVYTDPFSYFFDVIRGKTVVPKKGLYSLENNVQVVRILDAARTSVKTRKTVFFKP